MSEQWTVDFAHTGARLDVYLTEKLVDVSRAQLKKQIESGAFSVNGKPASVHRFLKEGDVIARVAADAGRVEKKKTTKRNGGQTPSVARTKAVPFDLNIIKETPDWLVVYKPHGVLMHPDHETLEGTLIDAVIEHFPKMAKVGEDPQRPGIVSRLDKDVSGLVVIAKTQDAFDHLKHQFSEHSVTKEYVALVHGEVAKDEGDLKFKIARSTSKARMAASAANSEEGQAAWTHFDVAERFQGFTMLRLQILTGRTHQIRAHLYAFEHPVIGDPLYKLKQTKRKIVAPRVMLQSVRLEFTDPATKERMKFEAPLDPEFDAVIKTLTK